MEALTAVHLGRRDITLEVPRRPVGVMGDRFLLTLIVTNILDNALKYWAAAEPVRCWVFDEAGTAVIEVVDRGRGISPAKMPRLFQRFSRVNSEESRDSGGLGLDLCVARELARRHGGDLLVRSETGTGSTFRLVVPTIEPRP